MGKKGDDYPERNYGAEYKQILDTQLEYADDLFKAEQMYQPKYTGLNLKNLNTVLSGTEGGMQRVPSTEYVDRQIVAGYEDRYNPALRRMEKVPIYKTIQEPVTTYNEEYVEGTPGLLDLYTERIGPAMDRMTRQSQETQRLGDIEDVEKYGERLTEAIRNADPQRKAIMDKLNAQAQEELDAGTSLTPAEQRLVQQNIRSSQASRGLGFGRGDAVNETIAALDAGRRIQDQRRGFASMVAEMNRAGGVDPLMAITGRQSSAPFLGSSIGGQAGGYRAGNVFNPESPYAQDVFSSNQNAQAAAQIARSNATGALIGGTLGAVGTLGGGAMMGAGAANGFSKLFS